MGRACFPAALAACALLVAGGAAVRGLRAEESQPPANVRASIEKGRAWLAGRLDGLLKEDGKGRKRALFPRGRIALSALALVHAGLPPGDLRILAAWERIRRTPPEKGIEAYSRSVELLLCEALLSRKGGPAPEEILDHVRKAAEELADGCRRGAWGYGCGKGGREEPPREARIGSGPFRGWTLEAGGDLSNTQYAVMGLKAAALCGIRPRGAGGLWRCVAQAILNGQERSGPEAGLRASFRPREKDEIQYRRPGGKGSARGWGYCLPLPREATRGVPTGSMTCGGLSSLLIARSELKDLAPQEAEAVDEAIRDGLCWLQEGFRIDGNPGMPNPVEFHLYYLYGLERVGMLSGLRKLGARDWYAEGSEKLLAAQRKDGSWDLKISNETDDLRTAYALLFLSRATSPRFARPYQLEAEEEKGHVTAPGKGDVGEERDGANGN